MKITPGVLERKGIGYMLKTYMTLGQVIMEFTVYANLKICITCTTQTFNFDHMKKKLESTNIH